MRLETLFVSRHRVGSRHRAATMNAAATKYSTASLKLPLGLAIVLTVLSLALSRGVAVADEPMNVRAITMNIRFNNPGDGPNAWPERKDWVGELLMEKQADVIGMQEVLVGQFRDLEERLSGYQSTFVGRDRGDERGEGCPVFFRSDRFEQVDLQTRWLSPTPEEVGSKGWDAALPRVFTHLTLREKSTDRLLHVFNTHFDHQGEEARRQSGLLLNRWIAEHVADQAWLAMGDLNATAESEPLMNLLRGSASDANRFRCFDARSIAGSIEGPDSTWNGFKEVVPNRRIDFIVIGAGTSVPRFTIDESTRQGRFPSDHLPVIVDLSFPAP